MAINLEVPDRGSEEEGYITYRNLGNFALEPTGELKSCYADGSSVLEGCLEIRITGAGMKMNLDRNLKLEMEMAGGDPKTTSTKPFHFMEIKMKDGFVYHILGDLSDGDEMIWDENTGEGVGYIHQGETVTGESYLGEITYGGGFNGWNKSGWESTYSAIFDHFIDVDAIAGVYLDGVELPLK